MTFDFLAMKTTSVAERRAQKEAEKEAEREKAQAIEQVCVCLCFRVTNRAFGVRFCSTLCVELLRMFSLSQAGLHRLELNPYWKDGGSGLPPEEAAGTESKKGKQKAGDVLPRSHSSDL